MITSTSVKPLGDLRAIGVPQVSEYRDLCSFGMEEAQVCEYADLWHPNYVYLTTLHVVWAIINCPHGLSVYTGNVIRGASGGATVLDFISRSCSCPPTRRTKSETS